MTFLQPALLWLLPFAALPLVIHLLNRMRYRTVHWAATAFLFSANRASTRHARLLQLLLLACRILALAALLLAVARPIAGAWAGWMVSSAPDTVLILLDRSASMETVCAPSGVTRRQRALNQIAAAAAAYGSRTRCVVIDSLSLNPIELPGPTLLPRLPEAGPTDTAADIPALLDAAAGWLARNPAAHAEIWLASDLRRATWLPESSRWRAAVDRIAALPQRVRIRLLAVSAAAGPNASVTLVSALRQSRGAPALDLTFDIQRSDPAAATLPITIDLDGLRTRLDLPVEGSSTRIHHSIPLDPSRTSGFGSIELQPDANARDNTAWFVYSAPPALRTAAVGPAGTTAGVLAAAAAPFKDDPHCSADLLAAPPSSFDAYAMVLWTAPLPSGPAAQALENFIRAGGVVLFFPPQAAPAPADGSFASASWGDLQTATQDSPLRVARWDAHDGPLADSSSGTPLPVASLRVLKAAAIRSGGEPLALFPDASPFLTQRRLGKGLILFCTTLPAPDWSSLDDGAVLVPMLQRLLAQGAAHLVSGSFADAGDPSVIGDPASWTGIDSPPRDIRSQAGVYRNGSRLIAVNRPASEDAPDLITPDTARSLFAPLPVILFDDPVTAGAALEGEIWRPLLFAALLFLIAENCLTLPPPARPPVAAPSARSPALAATRAS